MKCYNVRSSLLLLSLVPTILILHNLLMLENYIPIGYTIDIYSQFPSAFWNSLIAVYFIGCILILQKESTFKKVGVIYLLINYTLIFLVPYKFGYYSYGYDDELDHIGMIKETILTGHFDFQNIYPFTNILYSTISLMGDIKPNIASLILPLFFSLLFVFGILIFSRIFVGNKHNILLILFPASLIYYFGHFHFSNIPNYSYFTLVPILLFCITKYIKEKTYQYSFLLVIMSIGSPFMHPFIWFIYIYVLFLLWIYNIFVKRKITRVNTLLLLSLCSFGVWAINGYLLNIFVSTYASFLRKMIESVTVEGFSKISKIDWDLFSFLRFIFLYTGRYLVPLIFISIFIITQYKNRNKISKIDLKNIYYLIGMLVLFGLLQIILISNPLISHSPDRITNLNYIVFVMIPLFSISIYYIYNYNSQWKSSISLAFVLTFVFSLSVYGAFYSPYIMQSNIGSTYNELKGMTWLFDYKNDGKISDLQGSAGLRYSAAIGPLSKHRQRLGKDVLWSEIGMVPDHFGYDQNEFFKEDHRYVVVTTRGELLYQTVFKSVGRFNASDFVKFNSDPNVNKVYTSLNIKIYAT